MTTQQPPRSFTAHLLSSFTSPISSLPTPTPDPIYKPAEVPLIKNAKRLTTTRTKQLMRAAERAHDDPPPPPGLGECCGSSCDPCVTDLWREELACWRERWGEGAVDKKEEDGDDSNRDGIGEKGRGRCMPGSFEW
ncbi:hypothetical protein BDV23DRAFT_181626 [Aspergillus alliaceus]|uniref:Oxidoreductase-like domain-containing protein n=1 Tax=Petromyces alliaceus TaxID=209559 RepID=A0A5N7CF18_PETAA|nr:hypothetical protein BDV23DRAFT_181626 [Aspergillus alliaceus]